jgi:hypothetical protein
MLLIDGLESAINLYVRSPRSRVDLWAEHRG